MSEAYNYLYEPYHAICAQYPHNHKKEYVPNVSLNLEVAKESHRTEIDGEK